jgi:hypothetical protein
MNPETMESNSFKQLLNNSLENSKYPYKNFEVIKNILNDICYCCKAVFVDVIYVPRHVSQKYKKFTLLNNNGNIILENKTWTDVLLHCEYEFSTDHTKLIIPSLKKIYCFNIENSIPPCIKPYTFPKNKIKYFYIKRWVIAFSIHNGDFEMILQNYKHGDDLNYYIKKLKTVITPPPRPKPYTFPENKINCFYIYKNINNITKRYSWNVTDETLTENDYIYSIVEFKHVITPPPRPKPYTFPENKIGYKIIWKNIHLINLMDLKTDFEILYLSK